MGIRVATYAFARPVPYLFQQGVTETIQAPIRHGSTGALVAPTAAGSSVTITDPAGTEIVSGAMRSLLPPRGPSAKAGRSFGP